MDEIQELNRRLDEHSNMLLKESVEFARISREAVDARNAYDLSKAKAMLTIKEGTVPEKQAQVTLMCESQMIAARIAEAHQDAMKARLKAIADSLSAVQTRCRLLKTESDLDRYKT